MTEGKPVCAVVGVGPGNGAAFARKFASEGYAVALLARGPDYSTTLAASIPGARAYACDVSDEPSIERAFAAIASELGPVDVLIYNAGSGVWGNVEKLTSKDFEASWRVNALGAFIASKAVIAGMKAKKHGDIVFIGATASRRGNVMTAAFAPAKAAQRSLAESMARYLWPEGIHVSLVVVDGVVESERARSARPDAPDNTLLKPADVADLVFALTQQKPSAWSFEVEARPFAEKW
ncbi:MAG TPA: SDR family NAD(P)-dependent oxidoreductase [Polyangiaceae bacterium]|jgi:NAD(P)-dependent dehydrogenase (short-subunit alcohol dehydrogenase family)